MIYNDSYRGLDDLAETVERTAKALLKHKDRFDFIAVRGASGMLVGAPVSLKIGKPIVVVRKPDENSHGYGLSAALVNHSRADGRYIFLDDFISSGATERATREALRENAPDTEYVGSFEYCSGSSWLNESGTYEYAGKWIWAMVPDKRADDEWLVSA